MGNLANDSIQDDLGQLLSFYEVDLTSINPSYPITYWVQSVAQGTTPNGSFNNITNSPIVWTLEYPIGGTPTTITWNPIDLQTDQWASSSQGALPRPRIRLANILGVFTPSMIEYNDMVGGTIRRFRTYFKYIDGQPDASPTAYYGPDVWRIERKVAQNNLYVDFELANWIDQQNLMLPARVVIRDYCLARYRTYSNGVFNYSMAQCPYAGPMAAPWAASTQYNLATVIGPLGTDNYFYVATTAGTSGATAPTWGTVLGGNTTDGGVTWKAITGYWDQFGNATTIANDQCGKQKSDCLLRFPKPTPLPFWGFLGIERTDLNGGS